MKNKNKGIVESIDQKKEERIEKETKNYQNERKEEGRMRK